MVPEGGSAKLVCKARGYPKPEIVWKREDGAEIISRAGLSGGKTKSECTESWSFFPYVRMCFHLSRNTRRTLSNAIAFIQHEDFSLVSFVVLFLIALPRLCYFFSPVSKMIPFANRVLIINVTRVKANALVCSEETFFSPSSGCYFDYFSAFVIQFPLVQYRERQKLNKYFILRKLFVPLPGFYFTINGEFSFVLRFHWMDYCNPFNGYL